MKQINIIFLFVLIGCCLHSCSSESAEYIIIPAIDIETSEFQIDRFENNQATVNFETNVDWKAEVSYEGDSKYWLVLSSKEGKANKPASIVMTAQENTYDEDHIAYVTIFYGEKTHTLTVTLIGKEEMALISDKYMFIGAEGGNITITVNTNIENPILSIPKEAQDWLSYPQTRNTNKDITLLAVENSKQVSRWTTVTVSNSDKTLSYDVFVGQSCFNSQGTSFYYTAGGELKNYPKAQFSTKLCLFGTPDTEDFTFIQSKISRIKELDLSGTTITEIPDDGLSSTDITNIVLPESLLRIGNKAFHDCRRLNSLSIPAGVTSIGNYAFANCFYIYGTLVIPSGVTEIGEYAFFNCRSFTGSLIIPDGLTSIARSSFSGCTGFTGSLNIPQNVTEIGDYAFFECGNLDGTLTIPTSVGKIGEYAFYNCAKLSGSLVIPMGIKEIAKNTFSACSSFTGSLNIPESVTEIGDNAFSGCINLDGTLTIPDKVKSIGYNAFYNCPSLTGTLTIPISVQKIGESAFEGCASLSGSLIIPEGIKEIGDRTFSGCSSLTGSLTIPQSISKIGWQAFASCPGITDIFCMAVVPPTLGSDAFWDRNNRNKKLYVPTESVELYKNVLDWSWKFDSISPM